MKKTLGIIGAEQQEIDLLLEHLSLEKTVKKAGLSFFCGTIHEYPVVIVKAGIGKVNAAVCTQILVDEFGVDGVINTGIAGSLKAEINIGDIVLSTDVLHHDMDATGFGYDLGQIPQMNVFSFEADEKMRTIAKEVCEAVNPEIQVFEGRIVSGDQFISSREVKDRIKNNFDGYCTEMEGAAIAQTAYLNRIPFVIIRAISDKADDSATMDYPTFEKQAVEHSVRLTRGFLKKIQKES